jgi:hypothetical protein
MKGITWRGRALAVMTVALAVALVAVVGANATPPTREDLGTLQYEFSVDCSPYGFAFMDVVQGEQTNWIETFYDAQDNPVRTVMHGPFIETDTNSVTGKTLRFTGREVETVDLVAGTRTDVGQEFLMTDPGRGAVIHAIGRVVFDAPFHVSFEAGRQDVLHGDLDQLTCSALAAD